MGSSPHFQQGKPSQSQGQTRIQNPLHSAIQPRVVAPPQGPKLVAPPPPVYWPQPALQALQRKVAGEGQQNGTHAGPAVPPVYWPQPASHVLQQKVAGGGQQSGAHASPAVSPVYHARPAVVQRSLCNCRKSGNNHASSCPANPKQKKKKAKKVKEAHQDSQSIRNLYSYDSEWAKKRGITEEMIKAFVKYYGGGIHGHASSRSDKDTERHANTTRDIEAFHGWYNRTYE